MSIEPDRKNTEFERYEDFHHSVNSPPDPEQPEIMLPLTDLVYKRYAISERSDTTLASWDYTENYSLHVFQKHLRLWRRSEIDDTFWR